MVTVFSTAELRELGFHDAGLRELLRCCASQVRRGWFVLAHACSHNGHAALHEIHEASQTSYPRRFDDIRDNTERLKILIRSFAAEILPGTVFSHVSAAIILGLEPPFPATQSVEMIRPRHPRKTPITVCRVRPLIPEETARVGDLPVTTVRRTLLDLAHDYPLEVSVPFISQALRDGLVSKPELSNGIRAGVRGCRDAHLAVELASEKHESAGEALCAVKFFRFGITGMIPQVDAFDVVGTWIARNDFRHERLPLVVEFHGLGKYYLQEGGPDKASAKNHERHMRLINSGLRVFNLVWADLFRAREFRRIKSELDALSASRSHLSGEIAGNSMRSRR